MEEKLYRILSEVLKVDPSAINEESSPDNIASWDSFNGLIMVTELEKSFNVKFTMEEIMLVRTVRDIKESLRRHGVKI